MTEHLRVLELGEGLDEVEEQPLTMMMVDGITVIVGTPMKRPAATTYCGGSGRYVTL